MPELPEVETVRRGLEPAMTGKRLARVIQRRPDLRFPLPERFAERLSGRRIESVGRRAKYLLARLDRDEVLVMHLGMSGRFSVSPPPRSSRRGGRGDSPPPCGKGVGVGRRGEAIGDFVHGNGTDPAHDHIVFEMESGARITYNDPRRFGFMDLVPEAKLEEHKHFAGLGPEPLGNDFTPAYLASRALGKETDLKAFLLDQRIVAGLGNIYVCEALFRVGLSPHRGAACLAFKDGRPTARAERLVPAIRDVLTEAIAAGGSTLRNYASADGALGDFQHSFRIYGREGEPCLRPGCRGIIKRSVQASRSSFHCSRCQR
jgi:formamidopyrimidine-DNA glycosylase